MGVMTGHSGKKKRNTTLVGLIAILVAIVLSVSVHLFPSMGSFINLRFYDFKMGLCCCKVYSPDIVHLDVDDLATQRFGIWPWDRSMSGWILKRLTELGAKAVAFDVLYTSPGKSVEGNNAFFEAIKESANFVAATAFRITDDGNAKLKISADKERADALYDRAWPVAVPSGYNLFRAASLENSFTPLVPVLILSREVGHIKDIPDRDGVHRRVPMFVRLEDRLVPALSLATLAVYCGQNADGFSLDRSSRIVTSCKGEAFDIPVDSRGMMLIRWGPAWESFAHYSAVDLLDDEPNEAKSPRYRDKIVVVGISATGTTDFGITPLDSRAPLSRVHSFAMNTILTQSFIWEIAPFPYLVVLALVVTILFVLFSNKVRLRMAMLIAFVICMGFIVLSLTGFLLWSYEIPPAEVLIIFVPPVAICLVGRIVGVELDAYKASKALERYLSPELVKDIIDSGAEVDLNTKKSDLTIMFVDIQGFSTMSEFVAVEYVNTFLNDFFELMTQTVFEHKGTVDKFLGDGLLAFFGDPVPLENHALAGLDAALSMQDRMKGLNAKWANCGVPELERGMTIRIGLILEKVNVLEKKVSATIDIEQNVLGGKAPEKFYIINGDTAYIKIDGKLIGEYFSKIKNRRTEVR